MYQQHNRTARQGMTAPIHWVVVLNSRCLKSNESRHSILVCLFYSGFTLLSTIFQSYRDSRWYLDVTGRSMLTYLDCCFGSLKYHAPDTGVWGGEGGYGPFKIISLISSRLFIKGGRKPENPGKNHLTIRKQNFAFPHVTRAGFEPEWWET